MIVTLIIARAVRLIQQGMPPQVAARVAFLDETDLMGPRFQADLWAIIGGGHPIPTRTRS